MIVSNVVSLCPDRSRRSRAQSWNYGDGTPGGTGVTTSHTYSGAGQYAATLTVVDSSGATGTASVALEVRPTSSVGRYSLQFLPSDDGSVSRLPYPAAINNLLQVVGEFDVGFNAGLGRWVTHAFRYDDNMTRDIGTLGGAESFATDLNDVGQIVGASVNNNNPRAFLYANGVMEDLGALGGKSSIAAAINEAGVIVGASLLADGNQHAIVIRNRLMQDIGTLGGDNSGAEDVNDNDEILGWSQAKYESGVQYVAGFIYRGGVMQEIRSPHGQDVWPSGINNTGQVVGTVGHRSLRSVHET